MTKVLMVWVLMIADASKGAMTNVVVTAAYSTQSACEAAAETYNTRERREVKDGKYGTKKPGWTPDFYSCTNLEVVQ